MSNPSVTINGHHLSAEQITTLRTAIELSLDGVVNADWQKSADDLLALLLDEQPTDQQRRVAMAEALADYEAEFGAITEAEMEEVRKKWPRDPAPDRPTPQPGPTILDAATPMDRLVVEFDREADGRWIAEVLDLPGALTYGATRQEAFINAARLWGNIITERDGAPAAGTHLERGTPQPIPMQPGPSDPPAGETP